MKKMLCTLLAVMMLFALAGCAGKTDEEKIIGSWKTELSLASIAKEFKGAEQGDYFDFDKLKVSLLFTFREDGTCTMEAVEIDETEATLKEILSEGMEPYMKALASSMNVSYEDLMQGYTIDSLIDSLIDELLNLEEMKEEGRYRIADGKLYLAHGTDDFEDDEYVAYSFENDRTLKFSEAAIVDTEGLQDLDSPLTLTKQ